MTVPPLVQRPLERRHDVLALSYNVVSLNLARPDRPNRAQEVGVWIEPGYLVTDVAKWLVVWGCRTHA